MHNVLVAGVADVHVGNPRWRGGRTTCGINERGALVLDALDGALRAAKRAGAETFVVAGDLFDSSRVAPQLVAAAMDVLSRAAPMPVHIIAGNHDRESMEPGDHALGALRHVPNVMVHERPAVHAVNGGHVLFVPYRDGEAREWLPGALDALVAESDGMGPCPLGRLLVVHMGVADALTAPFLRRAPDAIEAETLAELCARRVDTVLAGNWHDARTWTGGAACILQAGALAPTGFNNPGWDGYGSMVLWGGGKAVQREPVVAGPRFIPVRDSAEFNAAVRKAKGTPGVFVRWTAAAGLDEARSIVAQAVAQGQIAGGEAIPGTAAAKASTARAATAARAASTLRDAVGAYVGKLGLPDPMRDAVESNALAYLRVGSADGGAL